jgi:hypothetical protein
VDNFDDRQAEVGGRNGDADLYDPAYERAMTALRRWVESLERTPDRGRPGVLASKAPAT